jgi:hypothetical protein
MMRPVAIASRQVGFDGILFAGRMPPDFAAFADALVRLDMRTGGHFLQKNLDWLFA